MNGIGSGFCPAVDFGINGVERLGSAAKTCISYKLWCSVPTDNFILIWITVGCLKGGCAAWCLSIFKQVWLLGWSWKKKWSYNLLLAQFTCLSHPSNFFVNLIFYTVCENNIHLTFRGPCIVIYSYNKSQWDALFLKFILIKNSTCFRQIYCPSSGVSTLYTQQ